MIYIVYAIHVLICLFLIMVVLLQQGSGADLSVFGGGGTQTAFGARSATNLLHKLTVIGFVGFILTTIAIGFMKSGSGGSVMTDVEQAEPVEESDGVEPFEAGTDDPAVEDGTSLPAGDEAADPATEDGAPASETGDPDSGEEPGGP